ncbi:Bifunctional aspartokinase/homoserine dehydrogenase 1 [Buchnera aphidicola (Cinara kochiana kochiana)]|uniref:Bifunctional aspartokinase/homoserine dehydrogenase n=1 Tax=Buchnera aphidicola (Cinara kochiana kochiana) TaxID=2518976 RepID=A0A451D5C8_9GAMM|nr:bifunctional aspartate kinase/homoserine dehydrogenase I [Buchnera aphidicola]VFP81051.1 Bifunctional aspartokinase/homoserine dehydrogenase 1 [Buchnera aphidicola (Cinara kochiana kochiana)]
MKTLKFGGTSLANAKKFIQVSSIIINQVKNDQIAVVLSAPANITNQLEKIIKKCIFQHTVPVKTLTTIKNFFLKLIENLYIINNKYSANKIKEKIIIQCKQLHDLLYKIQFLNNCPDKIYAKIICMGEILSVNIMAELLIVLGYNITILNPVTLILANSNYINAIVDINESKKRFQQLNICKKNIILMPGFIAGNKSNELVVLGRNGSDYSATILSICTNSHTCEIWTDVNGIYTCDPNIITTAQLLSEITYQEALELAYFGAKVIHPASIKPLQHHNIPCIIKNTNNSNHPGTLINKKNKDNFDIIKGITHLNNIILIKIYSTKNFNIQNISHKIFNYIHNNNISIYLLNQSLSINTISFYIQEHHSLNIKKELEKILSIEIQKKLLEPILQIKHLNIISIIGSNIKKHNINIIKKICLSLEKFNNKILEISYNISNISLSIVLDSTNTINIIKNIHDFIINKIIPINIFLIGIGGVGLELLKIISKQQKKLKKKFIQLNVNIIANSKKYIVNKKNINLDKWNNNFIISNKIFNLEKILLLAKKYGYLYPILIDCTASQYIAKTYNTILKSGFNIISANKKSNSSLLSNYLSIRKTANKYNKKFFYETHVGAGLPIINNLTNLITSGDHLIKFQGILSGSMSYIFGQLDNGTTISEATKKAQKLGFTEPNPKDDLSGIDVARKLLILAREFGYSTELSDITIEKILPKSFETINNKKKFLSKLKKLNNQFIQKFNHAEKKNKVLRFVGTIKNNGLCSVKIKSVSNKNPLYHIKDGENIFVFYTKYYQPIPLIIRGYGAGNKVTASGIFSDLLRIIL